jgi:hypothetical protein
MTVAGAGTGAAFEGEEWNATRLVKTRAALTMMIARCESLFIGVVLPAYCYPSVLQEH